MRFLLAAMALSCLTFVGCQSTQKGDCCGNCAAECAGCDKAACDKEKDCCGECKTEEAACCGKCGGDK